MFFANLIGNLGRDAELVTSKSGRQLIKLNLGVSMGQNRATQWVGVLMPDNPNLMPYLVKGTQLFVCGRVTIDSSRGYVDISVFADQVQLLSSKLYQQVLTAAPQPGVPASVTEPAAPAPAAGAAPAAPAAGAGSSGSVPPVAAPLSPVEAYYQHFCND